MDPTFENRLELPEAVALGPALPYAVEPARHGVRVWAATAILFAGLGLIVLGGCFLMGVMAMYTNGFVSPVAPKSFSPGAYVFILVLYALAFSCFAGAVAVIVAGLRGLFRIVGER